MKHKISKRNQIIIEKLYYWIDIFIYLLELYNSSKYNKHKFRGQFPIYLLELYKFRQMIYVNMLIPYYTDQKHN